ncbi:MAG: sulfatase [Bryobacteraceae bacterium]|nr:sulfatase [Bryobacteraceae bacterium]MDW8378032.1 sulfatase [Bryobacterales bacterium]
MELLSRRELVTGAVTALVASTAKARPRKPRPNILLLIADNWAYPHASTYGDPVVQTPTFDRIARQGVVFRNAFAPNPSCSPSRSSLLTGQESHRLRDAANLYGNLAAEFTVYPDILEASGYAVGFSGKGWGPGSPELSGRKRNPAGEKYASFAEFLRSRKTGQPFCFWFGSNHPHVPWNQGQNRQARMKASAIRVPKHLPDEAEVRQDILNYYCEVEEFDQQCREILEQLEQLGELDRTLVVMTSDNGWQMPRGLAGCYDLGVHVPLAMRWPGEIRAGSVRDDFVTLTELAPTFVEAAGLPRPASFTTKSLFSRQRLDAVFLERERHANVRRGDLAYPIRGVRTKHFLYLRNLTPERWPAGDPEFYWSVGPYGDVDDSLSKRLLLKRKPQPYFDLCFAKRPAEELYDLRSDPDQVNNVATSPKYAAVKADLSKRLDEWMQATADPRVSPTDFWDRVPYTGPKFQGRLPDLTPSQ